jgi:hypothetical protein
MAGHASVTGKPHDSTSASVRTAGQAKVAEVIDGVFFIVLFTNCHHLISHHPFILSSIDIFFMYVKRNQFSVLCHNIE